MPSSDDNNATTNSNDNSILSNDEPAAAITATTAATTTTNAAAAPQSPKRSKQSKNPKSPNGNGKKKRNKSKSPNNSRHRKLSSVEMTGQTIDHPLSVSSGLDLPSQTQNGSTETTTTSKVKAHSPLVLSPDEIGTLPTTRAMVEVARIGSITAFTTEVEELTPTNDIVGHSGSNTSPFGDDPFGETSASSQASLISVSCAKPTPETKFGIGFRSISGELQISHVSPTGLLANSPLRPGDRLVSLDQMTTASNRTTSTGIAHWTAIQAATYVRNHPPGVLTICVRRPNGDPNRTEAVVYKQTLQDKVGVAFYNDEEGLVRINYMNPQALLGEQSALKIGDYVESINGVNVSHLDATLALDLVRSAVGVLSIRAQHKHTTEVSLREIQVTSAFSSSRRLSSEQFLTTADEVGDIESGGLRNTNNHSTRNDDEQIRPSFMSVKVTKQTEDTKLGIAFMNPSKQQLLVGSILDSAMLSISPLVPGCIVHSINNIRCQTWTKDETLQVLRERVGEVLFMAQDPNGNAAYCSALAYKPSPRAVVGITFKSAGGPLRIGNIHADGIFSDSVLNTEDEVVSINNVPSQHLSPSQAVELIQRHPDVVWLVTKPHRDNGIVLSHGSGVVGGDEYERAAVPVAGSTSPTTLNGNNDHKRQRACLAIVFILVLIMIFVISSGFNCDPQVEDC